MPGTSSHTRIRLSGKGMKKVDGYGHGDHYITIKIAIPKHLNPKQKALAQAFAELETDTPGQILGVTLKTDGELNNFNSFRNLKFKSKCSNNFCYTFFRLVLKNDFGRFPCF